MGLWIRQIGMLAAQRILPISRQRPRTNAYNPSEGAMLLAMRGLRWIGERCWRWAPTGLASVLVVVICIKAVMAVDYGWDSLAYHIPFEALRAGLLTPWQLQLPPPGSGDLSDYYLGFPILGDLIRGWMWRLSGWPDSVNLFGIICLLALVGYLKWAFRLEGSWVLIGLLAVPAVQTAAASNYVDIPASAMLTVMLLSICDLWINPEKFTRPAPWLVLFVAGFAAANMKLQISVFAMLALPFVLPPAWQLLRRHHIRGPAIAGFALAGLCAGLLIGANLVKNLVLFGNPLFPITVTIAGIKLQGTWPEAAWVKLGRPWENLPTPVQWLVSVTEFHSLDGRGNPYTNGMGDVPLTALSHSMGGSFFALVVVSICFLVLALLHRRDRAAITLLVGLAITTFIIAFVPNGQNLRYVMFWMMYMIIGCLLLLRTPELAPYLQSYKIFLFSALVFVTSVTGGFFFKPVWMPMQAYVDQTRLDKLLDEYVTAGSVICLEQGNGEWDNRYTILFASIFHQELARERPYGVKQGHCTGQKIVPRANWR
jgi:hypothetical protein